MSTGVMIAFLPTYGEWCRQELPHLTLVFCGDIAEIPFTAFNDMAKDAAFIARTTRPFSLEVKGVEVFGDEDPVDVLTLQATAPLLLARKYVESWNKSEHPFNPHATIGPQGSAEGLLPTVLHFDQILVAWGNRHIKFPLGSY